MLKKLRRRIISLNLILVGIVLLAVFTLLCFNSYRQHMVLVEDTLSGAIRQAQDFDQDPFPDRGEPPLAPDSRQVDVEGRIRKGAGPMGFTPTVTVELAEDGSILRVFNSGVTLSEETLSSLVAEAADAAPDTIRRDADAQVFYRTAEAGDTTYLAITDASAVTEEMRTLIAGSLAAWLAFMFLFFLISRYMTNLSLKPVKEAWEQQQQFVADASHELKTPLTVILANSSILAEDPALSEDSRQWVDSTREEATHMQALVEQLLYLARSDNGSQKLLPEELSLTDLVREDILQFEPVAFERDVRIEEEIGEDIRLLGDGTMVKQLIHILLDNACKYAPAGSAVSVALRREKNSALLSVNNSGDPIPPEDLPHLFERFYRGDKARTSEGYGLGLAIAEAIAKEHKAALSVTSTAAEGTTFTVRFRELLP